MLFQSYHGYLLKGLPQLKCFQNYMLVRRHNIEFHWLEFFPIIVLMELVSYILRGTDEMKKWCGTCLNRNFFYYRLQDDIWV